MGLPVETHGVRLRDAGPIKKASYMVSMPSHPVCRDARRAALQDIGTV